MLRTSVSVTVSRGWVERILRDLGYMDCYCPVVFKRHSDNALYLTCRDTKMICDIIEAWTEKVKRSKEIDFLAVSLALRAGTLYQMLKADWNAYISNKMQLCPHKGGTQRKRYVYQACAEYRFMFT